VQINELVNKRLERLDSVPEKFLTSVDLEQRKQFKGTMKLLNELERDFSGNLLLSEINLARIEAMTRELDSIIFSVEYRDALVELAKEFNTQANINDQYFKKVFPKYENKEIYDKIMKNSQAEAVALLDFGAMSKEIVIPLKEIISQSLGKPFDIMVVQVRDFLEGTEDYEGQLVRYTKTYAYDSFATSDAKYSETIANDLGINKFRYQGNIIKDSREFCIARNDKIFSREEITSWGSGNYSGEGTTGKGQWQGRNRETNENNIFIYRGGYNCKHALVAV